MPTQQQQLRKPPQGQPGAGAGGGKGAGATPAPPRQRPMPQKAKPMGRPAAGAGGGKAGAQPAMGGGKKLKPLNQQQRQGLTQAAERGNLDVFLAKHPGMQKRFAKVGAGAGRPKQQANVQQWQAANTAAKAAGQPPPPVSTGAPGGGKPTPPPNTGTPTTTPPAEGPPPSFLEAFNTALGGGASETLGPMAWTGPNPIETARAAAQRGLEENLANVRARYAGSGFGNSAREALAEGQAVGDFATQFGDVAAARGLGERQQGLDRLAQMFGTAGAQDIQGRALGLQGMQQMANLGTGLTAIGAQEQEIPNLSNAIALLTNMAAQKTTSRGAMKPSK
jgi:hypothetical protein